MTASEDELKGALHDVQDTLVLLRGKIDKVLVLMRRD
jgi:hypothetical protein